MKAAVLLLLVCSVPGSGLTRRYSSYLGGNGQDLPVAASTDTAGNVYLTGSTLSSDFPTTAGAFQSKHAGVPASYFFFTPVRHDAFFVKLSPGGRQVLYSTYLGGSGNDVGSAIAVDPQGNVWILGATDSSDFPVTPNAFQSKLSGSQNLFLAEFDPQGRLVYATYLGGSQSETPGGLALDPQGNPIVTGSTQSSNFPYSAGALQSPATTVEANAFVVNLSAKTGVLYSARLGPGLPVGLAVDSGGNAFVLGSTSSASFPVTGGAIQQRLAGAADLFLSKLNASGSALLYSTYLGGKSADYPGGVALDSTGNAYVGGTTDSTDFPITQGALGSVSLGSRQPFLLKVNPQGTGLIFSTFLGDTNKAFLNAVTVASNGNVYAVGSTSSADFPVTPGALPRSFDGSTFVTTGLSPFGDPAFGFPGSHAFLAELDSAGRSLLYSTMLEGSTNDNAATITVDASGVVTVAGSTQSADFPVTSDAVSQFLSPAICTYSSSPSSSQSQPCEDIFLTSFDQGSPAVSDPIAANGATLSDGPVAPGEILTFSAASIGTADGSLTLDASGRAMTALAGVQVLFDGVAAPLIRVGQGRVTAVAPFALIPGRLVQIEVDVNGQPIQNLTRRVLASAPGIFTVDGSGRGQALAINEDGTLNGTGSPAKTGSIVSIYATGLGQMKSAAADGVPTSSLSPIAISSFYAIIGNISGEVLYAGAAPTLIPGVYQINVRIRGNFKGPTEFFLVSKFQSTPGGVAMVID